MSDNDKKILTCPVNKVVCPLDPVQFCHMHETAIESHTRYSRILEYSFEEIYIFGAEDLLFKEVSKGALTNLGYTIDELKAMTPADIKPKIGEAVFKSILRPLAMREEEIARFSTIHERKDGSHYDVDIRLQYVKGTEPVFIAMVTDVTERNAYEAELKAMAFRDPGTDLYNRRYFLEQMEGTINHANRVHSKVGLVLIDMDDFSIVNNTHGHLAGDKIIVKFAEKIKEVFSRKTDVVARYGGDEFVVMCIDNSVENLKIKCQELIELFNEPEHYEGHEIIQTASIGICVRPEHKKLITSKDLIKGADRAMYEVKDQGKNSVRVCEHEVE